MTEELSLEKRLTLAVASLTAGEVISYGDVAERAGAAGAPRAAGRFLAKTRLSIPWWRVVYSDGRLPEVGGERQAAKLRSEGVEVRNGRVCRSPKGRFAQS